MSGHVSFIGAAVRDETGSAEPARYSTRSRGVAVAMGRDPPGVAVATVGAAVLPCRKSSGGVGFGSDQRPRLAERASDSAAA